MPPIASAPEGSHPPEPNALGLRIQKVWRELHTVLRGIETGALIINPRDVQGCLRLPVAEEGPAITLSAAVRLFKSASARQIARLGPWPAPEGMAAGVPRRADPMRPVWKKGYQEKSFNGTLASSRSTRPSP